MLEESQRENKLLSKSAKDYEERIRFLEKVEIPKIEQSLHQKKLEYEELQKESKRLVFDISNERMRLLEENQRQGFILDDRIKEIEQRSW